MANTQSFHSKILLFGEYSIIQNSMALAIPYNLFEGKLVFPEIVGGQTATIDGELKGLCQYMRSLDKKGELNFKFDLNSFEFDVGQGLRFNSTIPQGFGLGSSGALCAAIYCRYGNPKLEDGKEEELKQNLSVMESYFHGASSGFDPLISYLNRPILIKDKNLHIQINLPKFESGKGAIFLLNTGRARRTEPLVNLFLEKCKDLEFKNREIPKLISITDSCINNFLEGDIENLNNKFKELSQFQLTHLNPMIPKLHRDIWAKGILTNDFYLKLCGAGGGGFILGMTRNLEEAKNQLGPYDIRSVLTF